MDTKKIMEELDRLLSENRPEQARQYLEDRIGEAKAAKEYQSLLVLYNEAMGFYRETGSYRESIEAGKQALELMDRMGIAGTIPYATTLLNMANAYRAAGLLQESWQLYQQILPIYESLLEPEDMYFANYYNNLSLLYQEMQNFTKAKEAQEKALALVSVREDIVFETAVTYANIANTCIALGEEEQAEEYAKAAIALFEEHQIEDAHYSAALSALGSLYYKKGKYEEALSVLEKSQKKLVQNLGADNTQYERLTQNIELIKDKLKRKDSQEEVKGLALCRGYYEMYGKPMIQQQFSEYQDKIAVGLVGQGSDCFGFDDALSKDHDFGPRFVMWVTKDTYEKIGEKLQKAYESLPKTFMGVERIETFHGRERAGVFVIEDFYEKILGLQLWNASNPKVWLSVQEYALAAAVNGEVFCDSEGIFTKYREELLGYYPKAVWFRRAAQAASRFSQAGQYNFSRMLHRNQIVAAELAKAECIRQAMELTYLLLRTYAPHDKWLYRGLERKEKQIGGIELQDSKRGVLCLLRKLASLRALPEQEAEITDSIEQLAALFAEEMNLQNMVGESRLYLDSLSPELLTKSDFLLAAEDISKEETKKDTISQLSLMVAQKEFEAFDKVQNEGGRASCQNNWPTFKIMRMSQYLTWSEDMLLQYLYDFETSLQNGRNMVEEKYARMMKSTAPQKYATFEEVLPIISPQKCAIMEEIIKLQVQWMEDFAQRYPKLAQNARLIHTSEDTRWDTSYETYLRGELGTYSDKMLELYGRYIVEHVQAGKNVAEETMKHTIHFYGYQSFEEAGE